MLIKDWKNLTIFNTTDEHEKINDEEAETSFGLEFHYDWNIPSSHTFVSMLCLTAYHGMNTHSNHVNLIRF